MKSCLIARFAFLGTFMFLIQSCTHQISPDDPLIADIYGKEFVLVQDANIAEYYCGKQPYRLYIRQPPRHHYHCYGEAIGILEKGSHFIVEGFIVERYSIETCRTMEISFEFNGHALMAILKHCSSTIDAMNSPFDEDWILPISAYADGPIGINPLYAVPKGN